MKKTSDKPARIISATITAGGTTTRYPAPGDREHTKPVSAEIMKKTGEIIIFEDGAPVAAFLPTSFFVPEPGKTGMWWKGTHKGKPATLCITSLTDGGDKVNGASVSVIQPLKYSRPR